MDPGNLCKQDICEELVAEGVEMFQRFALEEIDRKEQNICLSMSPKTFLLKQVYRLSESKISKCDLGTY